MRMNKKKEVVPKLRFPEYIGNKLKITKLGKISSIVKEKAGENEYTLMSVTSGVGLIPQAEKFGREIAGDSYKNYIVIKKYDFAYNKSATKQFPEGYISMLEKFDIAAVPNSIFTCFRITDNEAYPPFFDYLWHNNYHGHWLRKYIEVGARAHGALSVDTKHLWSMPLALPDFNEQQKIADCLSSIDDLIGAESRKLKALEKCKKGLMQKLFPAEGKTLPEWRFPEFSDGDGWIKTSLSQICIMQAGKFINSSEISDEQENNMYPCYGGNGLRGYTLTHNCSGDHPLIGRQGALCGNVTFATGNFYATEHAIVVTANKNIDEKWLYYLLDYLQLNQYATGQAQPGLSVQTLEKVTAIYPGEVEEQKKIANCLSEIDAIIAEQSNKVERLKAHKKGLLQGLFPSLKEADV